MTLRLTTEMCEHGYVFLTHTQPFDRWNLPDAHDIRFALYKKPFEYGYYQRTAAGDHTIAIGPKVGHTVTLLQTLAHEMVHLYQAITKMETSQEHNAAFRKLWQQVCRHHGWDPKPL